MKSSFHLYMMFICLLSLHHSNKSNFHQYFYSDRTTEKNKNSRTFDISLSLYKKRTEDRT